MRGMKKGSLGRVSSSRRRWTTFSWDKITDIYPSETMRNEIANISAAGKLRDILM
jgi:hypothetical protein